MVAAVDSRARVLPELVRRRLSERVRAFAEQVAELDPGAPGPGGRVPRGSQRRHRRAGPSGRSPLRRPATVLAHPDGEPVGKRLDFLLQEIHRETNTVGSKSSDLEISRLALELKGEAEKVREQVQNLE